MSAAHKAAEPLKQTAFTGLEKVIFPDARLSWLSPEQSESGAKRAFDNLPLCWVYFVA
jgi:hypothetical protein